MAFDTRIASGWSRARTGALLLALTGLLAACASVAPQDATATRYGGSRGQAAAQRQNSNASGGRYKVGAPYQQFGVWYVPAEQPDYDAVGLASWYGDAFDRKRTANGEIFDMQAITAAHATLPMPCLVEVTNLDNGRKIVVRMNDRGPYHPGRIIDLSRAGAEALGYAVKGTARVRVRYVGPALLDGGDPALALAASPQGERPWTPSRHASSVGRSGARYVIQAGAFAVRANAERAASQLASAGTTTITPVNRGGGVLYRVLVGPWSDRETAADARTRIAALGFGDARLSEES